MAAQRFLGEHIQVDTLDAAGRPLETALDHLLAQADGLENLRPLVRLQGRDADLGHDLEHAIDHALAIIGDDGIVIRVFLFRQQAITLGLEQRLESQVRIDRVGAVADQQTVVMHFARLAGFDHDTNARAQAVVDQMMMHGADRQQAADRHTLLADVAVRKHNQTVAVVDRLGGLEADILQAPVQACCTFRLVVGDVDRQAAPAIVIHMLQSSEFFVIQDRVWHAQTVGVLFGGIEQVGLGTDIAFQRHHDFLADRVDRRVGHLREQLLEIVINHARLVGQAGKRGIVAHRADRIAQLLYQRYQHELHGLGGVAKGLHARQQGLGVKTVRFLVRRKVRELDFLIFQPLAVRTA